MHDGWQRRTPCPGGKPLAKQRRQGERLPGAKPRTVIGFTGSQGESHRVSSGAEYHGPAYLPSEPNSWGFSRCSRGLPHRHPCLWSIAC